MFLQEAYKKLMKNGTKPLMSSTKKTVVDLNKGGTTGKLIRNEVKKLKRNIAKTLPPA